MPVFASSSLPPPAATRWSGFRTPLRDDIAPLDRAQAGDVESGAPGLADLGQGSARLRDLTLRAIGAQIARAAAATRRETAATNLETVAEARTLEELQLEETAQAMKETADYQTENTPPVVTNDPFGLKGVDDPEPVDPERRLAELTRAEQDIGLMRQEILVDSTETFLAQANVRVSAALHLLA